MRILLFILTAAVVPAALPSYAGSGFERGLGRPVAEQLEEEMGVVRDPALSAWVESIGCRIVQADGGNPRDYTFKILNSDDVNAFAIPGGYVYVTIGLLRFVDSEDELAATVGHEIHHITAHHGLNQFKRDLLLTLGLTLLRGRVSDAISAASQVGGVLYSLQHSRGDEAAADAGGVAKVARAGYDPIAMASFLRKLDEREKNKPSRLEVYFMTHPPTADRLRKACSYPETDLRNLCVRRAVARGLAERGLYRQAILVHEQILSREPEDAEGHLAAGFCWERLGRPDRAREERLRARAINPAAALPASPAPKAPSSPGPAAPADAVARASAALAQAHAQVRVAADARRKRIGDIRKALDGAKRRFRRLLAVLHTAAQWAAAGDLSQREMLHKMGIAVANLERAISRVEATADAADSVPDQFAQSAKALNQRLGRGPVDSNLVAIAETLPPSASRALAELETGLDGCGQALKLIDSAVRVCHTAAQDLVESAFLPAPAALARITPIHSRLNLASKAAASAAETADDACTLADAAEARRRAVTLDRLGYDTPSAQRAAICSLLARRYGVPASQAGVLASDSAHLGQASAALLLGLAVRVPLKKDATAASPSATAPDDRPIKPLTVDQALERRVPLAPLNVSLRLFALDIERESGETLRP